MKKTKFFKFELIRRAVIGTIFLCILGGAPSVAYSATIALQWNPPTNNMDTSPLVNLAFYRLYYGFKSTNYVFLFDTNQPRATLTELIDGSNYYFVVTAVNSNNVESDFCEECIWSQKATPPAILTSANAVTVPEGGAATFQVKLSAMPVCPTTVTVSRAEGDADIAVSAGASLAFNASNWNIDQTVTLAAAEDADTVNSSTLIRCSAAELTNQDVTATEQDNDGVVVNLALASRGSAITGSNGANWDKLIDGVANGYDGENGYGFTYWTNAANAPGGMTLDLKGLYVLSSMKLLLWDQDNRYYRYKIEASLDNTTWTPIVDRTSGNWQSWQNISFSATIQARYLRLIGTYNSANVQFHVAEWEVYGAPTILTSANAVTVPEGGAATFQVKLSAMPVCPTTVTVSRASGDADIAVSAGASLTFSASNWNIDQTVTLAAAEDADTVNSSTLIRCSALGLINQDVTATEQDNDGVAVNLALASRGSAITGSNGANWDKLIDGVANGYDGENGYGFTYWTNAANAPGGMTLDLKGLYVLSSIKLLLWDQDNRYYRYKIEASLDNTTWTPIVDRTSGNWQSWQNISFSATIQARYLRLIGTYNSANVQFHVAEWEVYGAPAILTGVNAITVPEGGAATFQVKLSAMPVCPTTVTVSRASGDADIAVSAGASLTFSASNWNIDQTVTLAAAEDADTVNSSTLIRCSALGLINQDVTATEQDNDGVAVNLALASRGSAITGSNGTNWDKLIDGVANGYDGESGYGYTYWTNAANAPGSMTLDLKGLYVLSSIKLLLWDQDNRYYRYKIEASLDNTTWTPIVDRTSGNWQSWQSISFSATIQARYLRLIGTYNSANVQFHVAEWEVYGAPAILTSANAVTVPEGGAATFQVKLSAMPVCPTTVTVSRASGDADIAVSAGASLTFSASNWNIDQTVTLAAAEDADTVNSSTLIRCSALGLINQDVTATEQDNDGVAVNLALASRGSAITGSNGANWDKLIDGVANGYDGENGYGYTYWTNAANAPGGMTLDLKGLYVLSSIKLLLWDQDNRYYRYKIEASLDNTTWTPIVDRTSGNWQSWQSISFSATIQARYLRLIGTYNSANVQFHVAEWEVYGAPAILTSANAVTVPEGGAATFQVKLSTMPVCPTTVTVSRASGDADIAVSAGASLTFSASNWNIDQTVTLAAAEDADTVNSSTLIRCSALGLINQDVTATEQDNDGVAVNLALASRGSAITGSNGANWDKLIDGVANGYDGENGYGYTYWTNAANAPGGMTLDLKGLYVLSSIKLLLWDQDNRYYRYKIEASLDNTTWTPIVDRTSGNWQSWQNISFSATIQARYLRLIGTYNSANVQFHVVEWEVYGAPAAETYTIAPTENAHGSITPNTPVALSVGQNTSFVIRAAPDYYIASLTTNGAEERGVAGLYEYTSQWINVRADGTFTVAFASVASDTAVNDTPIPWLRRHYTNGHTLEELKALAHQDTDGDGMLTWKEYRSRTDPTDGNKFLRFSVIPGASESTDVVVQWTSESGVVYRLEMLTNLMTNLPTDVCTNIPATPPLNTATDKTAIGNAVYYRIGVER